MKIKKLFRWNDNPQGAPTIKATPELHLEDSYSAVFMKPNRIKTRQCVYVSNNIHFLIAKLVRRLNDVGNDTSIGGYIDTVLNEHLQHHKKEINELFRQNRGDLL